MAASSDSEPDEGPRDGPESRGQVLQRHKREQKAVKAQVARLGKKKKDEAQRLEEDTARRHAAELVAADVREAAAAAAGPAEAAAAVDGPPDAAGVDSTTAALAATSVSGSDGGRPAGGTASAGAGPGSSGGAAVAVATPAAAASGNGPAIGAGKPSKAQKARAKRAKEEAEREARIREEQAGLGPSVRATEEAALAAQLTPLSLGIRPIRADGHCLYRALVDQLSLSGLDGGRDHVALRALAAAHMRTHADEYLPYLDQVMDAPDPAAAFDRYCSEVESTATWGGQLELNALAAALGAKVEVYSAGMPVVVMGPEEGGAGAAAGNSGRGPGGGAGRPLPLLRVCFQRHAFGLGEHYNSIGPVGGGGPLDGGDEGGD